MPRPFLLSLIFAVLLVAPARAALDCNVVAAHQILSVSTHGGDEIAFTSAAGLRVPLVLDAEELDVQNPAFHGRLYPIDDMVVRSALAEMAGWSGPPIPVTIYCLPGYPSRVGRSFAVGREIFLAPGFDEVPAPVVAYTVVHEIGHVVQNVRMPGRRGARWQRYLQLRGITDTTRHHEDASHRDRPGEIFAEDFRALLGGPLATYSGTLEHPDLVPPTQVPGLVAFMREVLGTPGPGASSSVLNHPNPFNPQTTIVVRLAADVLARVARVQIDVVDLRGRRVRNLGALPADEEIRVPWSGTDDTGQRVASGRYFCRVRAADVVVTTSMLLLQ